jgi:hypothetical protein
MGNTASIVVDIGLRAVCVATNGQYGKSDEGYHVGPLRLKKDSIRLKLKVGIFSFGINLGKNEFGRVGVDAGFSCKVPGVGAGTIMLGTYMDTDGIYVGLSTSYNMGLIKIGKCLLVNENGCLLNTGVTGPMMTEIKYSHKTGLSVGALGVGVNENRLIEFTNLKKFLAVKLVEKIKGTYTSSNLKAEKQNEKSKILFFSITMISSAAFVLLNCLL